MNKISPYTYPGIDKAKTDFMGEVVKIVAEEFSVTPSQLYSDDISRKCSRPRYYAIYLIRKVSYAGVVDITKHFNRVATAHSLVRSAVRFTEGEMAAYPQVKAQIKRLIKSVREMHEAIED